MAKARKLPSGSWQICVYLGTDGAGKKKFKSITHPDKKTCEFMAAEYQLNHKNSPHTLSDLTFAAALDRYIESKSNVLSPTTLREYKVCRRNYFKTIAPMRLQDITQNDIQMEINDLASRLAPKTVRNIHGMLSAVFSVYRPNFKLQTALPQKVKKQLYIPDNDDIKKIVQCAAGKKIELPIMLAAFGSLRRSEISALTYDDIDGCTVRINKALVKDSAGKWVTKTTKTVESTRFVEMPQYVIDKILPGEGNIVDLTPDKITHHFARLLKNNGIPHFRFHDLRHYQASILHAMGVPDKYIMQRGGWRTDNTLKNIYQHTFDKTTKEVNDKINGYFTDMLQDPTP